MKRAPLKRIGKQGRINIEANKTLKEKYRKLGINSCEIKLEGCLGAFTARFAHKHRRVWYYKQPELLSEFNETLLACSVCHSRIDNNKELLNETFKRLRK